MLERAAGCLETGSLRRLLPGSQSPLKSRRMLHSCFWSHGAIDLEYSHLWEALMRNRETTVDEHEEAYVQSVATSFAGGFLDFLYPFGALRLLRQYSLWKSDAQDSQRARPGFGRFGQRLYTSIAAETSTLPAEEAVDSPKAKCSEARSQAPAICKSSSNSGYYKSEQSYSASNDLKNSQNEKSYDNIWEQFMMVDVKDRRQNTSTLLTNLSTSYRISDAERATSAFEDIRITAGYGDYGSVIKLYLNCGMLQEAMELYREGLTKFDIPVGSDMMLAYALKKCQWQLACDIWINFRRFREAHPSLSYNIWSFADELYNLPDQAIQLAGFAKEVVDKSGDVKHSPDMSALATLLANRALLFMSRAEDVDLFKFNTLVKVLQHWDADSSERYESIIERLLDSGHTKVAIRYYREYRKRTTEKISNPILHKVLKVVCKHHSVPGMQQVLDDWFRFYSKPPPVAYKQCMSAFASIGDITTVKNLFQQYVQRIGGKEKIKNADDLTPLLAVYSNRGELSQVVEIFDTIEEKYGVQPSISCWNILINAYGKVLDMEAAFAQFRRLLASSVQPDSYTYGTLMGICTDRGDLDQAMEVYRRAESQRVAISRPMVDCLVLGHIQDDRLVQAEKYCIDALAMDFKTPLTRMWNYLLTAYAMRSDLENTNRILHRMHTAGVEYDGATYSALMQALVMARQPDRAKAVLDVMHNAGVRITSFHYAVLMGGYIRTGELHKVFQVNDQMLRLGKKHTTSTRLMILKANVLEDQDNPEFGSQEEQWTLAEKYFLDAYTAPDAQERVERMRKGMGYEPLDSAYQTSYFGYLIFVLAQRNALSRVTQVYEQYLERIPKGQQNDLSLKILSALMIVSLRNHDYDSVQQCWDLAFQKAERQGQPFHVPEPTKGHKILSLRKKALTIHLTIQMRSLAQQQKSYQLFRTKDKVEKSGFELDNKNWNTYIQCLAGVKEHKMAFYLCELMLMGGWSGWARLAQGDVSKSQHDESAWRLRQIRRRRGRGKDPRFLMPYRRTLLLLAKAYIDIQGLATESAHGRELQKYIESQCRKTLYAVQSMERMDDELEREIFGSS